MKYSVCKYILVLLLVFFMSEMVKAQEKAIQISPDLKLIPLSESFYVHVSYFNYPDFGRVASNGLIFIQKGKALLIDTPGDNKQTKQLVSFLRDSLQLEIKKLIVGHSHNDCIGGLDYIHSLGIESVSGLMTQEKCKTENLPIPKITFDKILHLDFEGEKLVCQYFGGGHTQDNIVVYFPGKKLLFGGCLIKSLQSKSLGYTGEADIENWDKTVEQLMKAYLEIDFVIPGHGAYGDSRLLTHTIDLVKKNKGK
ncbi:subclass B1 metallo-beta-lactamase [Ancylomarina euxinus]|uniref:beta-lactamase n=1 Tax=Ancylomarina euxinus TaxID=2283627 RepID=A0A425XYR8_9BACT|nr:subclass B1 metallo-beta-lactamase [Ancylomarina euxinus]MCZ4695710.1 subclass B1 metallo-beta-lactamase [Ancylomarina euxinus]MUP16163.1 subclass B1 metallo-beta-lactamase [Ancylomarina euxinus]RRG20028.1 subclass B1 metallo-beta-lactamase [Ancylomarina euxinus]